MNPPIPKSVCEEEMQNANLDTDEVIIEYMTDAHGSKIKKIKTFIELNLNQIENIPNTYLAMMISLLYLMKILHKRGK